MSLRQFPSPLEVYRFISSSKVQLVGGRGEFPSPREVNRFISAAPTSVVKEGDTMFPSPLEVDRFISFWGLTMENFIISYRPLSR